ncbi:LysR family transcriptional regulator [Paenibacillus glycanilyticus]|uniref:LysR family transcriptional regulator n=1 Tax=Paenibacillus glycanilyticus TaxID=126569 RepID=A0ABQ6GAI7_9BACL|nr:LysR family transcriptional regulator [Paenibacillus glycanilyticus]GLX67265.1 LysR family transcriptional regulator [Paenibacillus glycanilyticus]
MNIDQLEYVLEVAKVKSISAASNNLHVTLPAISQSITHLETELGVKMFTRSRHGTFPTAEGIILIEKASEIIEKVRELREEAQSFTNTVSGELRIATIPGPMSLLVKTVAAFKRDFPNIRIEISETHSQEMITSIHQDKIDLGLLVLYEDLQPSVEGLKFTKVMDVRMACCVNKTSPLALRDRITAEDLLRYPLALYNEDYIDWYIKHLNERYGSASVLFTTNNIEAIRQAIDDQLAITLGLNYSFNYGNYQNYPTYKVLDIDLPTAPPVPLGWMQAKSKTSSKIIKTFIQRLQLQFPASSNELK